MRAGRAGSALSKSRFVAGLQCHKLLWWRSHEPDAPELRPDPALEAVFDRGTRVGEVARSYVPGGTLIDFPPYDVEKKVVATRQALEAGIPVIYEASFLADDVFVGVDILERVDDGWTLIEVKSTASVKEQHLHDVAVQVHVARRAGVPVVRAELMHLNRRCRHPDLGDLFVRADVTGEVEQLLPNVPCEVDAQMRVLAGPLPAVATGPQCSSPYACPFQNRCWPELPPDHVSTLYRVGSRLGGLLDKGIESIRDLPENFVVHGPTERQVRAVRENRVVVEPGLEEALSRFRPPLAFLDFETVQPAIPVWPGCAPYDQVPVQFSCHTGRSEEEWVHRAYLADGPGDPREVVAEQLLDACAGARTVLVFNASFERRGIELLAGSVPRLTSELHELAGRVQDLLPVVRDHVYHPGFGGSFSLKAVLPALVPGVDYSDLEIAEGGLASVVLEELLLHGDGMAPVERERTRENLLRYCERDTWAMVRLFEALRHLAAPRP